MGGGEKGEGKGGKGKEKGKDKGKSATGKGKSGKGKGQEQWVAKGSSKGKSPENGKGKGKGEGQNKGKGKGKGKPRWVVKAQPSVYSTHSFGEISEAITKYGGELRTMKTEKGMGGSLECAVFEPPQEAAPRPGVGVIVCLQGLPPSEESIREWSSAAQSVGWLGLGAIVAVPNFQMSSGLRASDLGAVIELVLSTLGADECVLVVKDIVAPLVIQALAEETISKVVGLLLLAPSSPAPFACSKLKVPVLLLWAQDDDVCAIQEQPGWVEALDAQRGAPTTIKTTRKGKHRFDKMLGDELLSEAVKNFTVSVFLIANLGQKRRNSEDRVRALTEELPEFIRSVSTRSRHGENDEEEAPGAPERRLKTDLPGWLQSGMVNASE